MPVLPPHHRLPWRLCSQSVRCCRGRRSERRSAARPSPKLLRRGEGLRSSRPLPMLPRVWRQRLGRLLRWEAAAPPLPLTSRLCSRGLSREEGRCSWAAFPPTQCFSTDKQNLARSHLRQIPPTIGTIPPVFFNRCLDLQDFVCFCFYRSCYFPPFLCVNSEQNAVMASTSPLTPAGGRISPYDFYGGR